MNPIDGIRLVGSPANIPDSNRGMLPAFCAQQGYEVGAEIGTYKGDFTALFCKEGLEMNAIDPWIAYAGGGRSQSKQDRQDFLYEHACRTLKPYHNCTIIRKPSMEALDMFKDGSLDFVFIDGDHSFPRIAEDIYCWSKKVRKGGLVSGHDYFNTWSEATNVLCHVEAIVDAYTKAFGITQWWTFVRSKPLELEDRSDKTLSWMWLK